jgi:hypothetical protein
MAIEKSPRRLPLRDLLTDAEKRTRDLLERFHQTLREYVDDLRDLSRPSRKKSAYPTLVALRNSLTRFLEADTATSLMLETLNQELEIIREHAQREKLARRGG